MHSKTVQFLFDFGSPNAYLCHKVLPQLEARVGTGFEYVPILLGGLFKMANNRSPLEAYAHIPNKLAYEQLVSEGYLEAVPRKGYFAASLDGIFPPVAQSVAARLDQKKELSLEDLMRVQQEIL